MPELPEVETIKRDLEKVILQKRIVKVIVRRGSVIKEPAIKTFKSILKGSRCTDIFRRGKLLIIQIKTRTQKTYFLTVHLRMTGQLVFGSADSKSRVSFLLSDRNYLNYNDQRMLGELRLVTNWKALNIVKSMGPEPLDKNLKVAEFKQSLLKRSTKIKPLLLDQSFIAGMGNIYAAEALFISGISPLRRADNLSNEEIEKLFKNIKAVLNKAIQCRGSSFSDYRDGRGQKGGFSQHFYVYGRHGQACLKCDDEVKRIVLGGRGTYFCGRCQK